MEYKESVLVGKLNTDYTETEDVYIYRKRNHPVISILQNKRYFQR